MSEELGTRTEALKSNLKLLHEYREDSLEKARYHYRLAQEMEQATFSFTDFKDSLQRTRKY